MPAVSISTSQFQGWNLPDRTDNVEFVRGGFWRRALAFFIDLLAIVAVLQVTALALFPLSNGYVQFSGGPFYALNCEYLERVPEGVSTPAGFDANSITDCEQRLLGLPTSRTLSVGRISRDGFMLKEVQIRYRLDAEGKPVGGLPLDIFVLPLLIALRFGLDRIGGRVFAGSIGRRICRVRLSSALDGRYPPPAAAVTWRYVALALPLAPIWIWSAFAALAPGPELVDPTLYWVFWIVTGIPLLIAALEAADAIIRRSDAFYDRFAQTSVLRLDRKNAVMPTAVARPSAAGHRVASRSSITPEVLASYATTPPLPPPALRLRNYAARHWRGEFSLPVSCWLNGILGGLVIGGMIVALAYAINRKGEAQPLMWLFSLIVTWALAALLTIWQAVGVWRSAICYRQSGKRFWGAAAKALVVIGAAQFAASFMLVGTAQMAGFYEIVTGDARVGPHQFQVLANGQTLEFSGGITFGVSHELEQLLDAMADVRVVRLNSSGGRILEAQKMSDLIRRRNLSTFVATDCLSACTIVFLGGKERLVFPTAQLGFHQPTFRGMTAADRRAAIATERQRLQRFGLSRAFSLRATSASPSGMWYPDQDELVREHVVTRVMMPREPGWADRPVANVAPLLAPTSEEHTGSAETVDIVTPSMSVGSVASTSDPATSGNIRGFEAGLPADLPKRLSSAPRDPAGAPK
jgi:hypothetical protein